MDFELTSPAFQASGPIPRQFTCEGLDRSPALIWTEPPAGTQSFSLIMDDPDAPKGTWVHWVLYDIPATIRELHENVTKEKELSNGARQGRNDFRSIGYGGPCPPKGPAHRYCFKLYALDAKTGLRPGATKADLERAIGGHILAEATLIGRYQR
jgi:Raf kinase inhibitor-like YbhB/YbcL family protein